MTSTRVRSGQLTPRKLPKQRRSQATVRAILEAAAQVFERHGYAAGTTNRIAARAGVSIGSLYQYFPNKDAILLALVHEHLAEGTAALEPHLQRLSDGARFDDVLPHVVAAMVALHAQAPGLHRVLFEETPLPPALRAELDRLEDHLVAITAAALAADASAEDPVAAAVDLRLTARVAINAIEGLTHRLVLRPPPDVTPDTIAAEVTKVVRAYIETGGRSLRPGPISPQGGRPGPVPAPARGWLDHLRSAPCGPYTRRLAESRACFVWLMHGMPG